MRRRAAASIGLRKRLICRRVLRLGRCRLVVGRRSSALLEVRMSVVLLAFALGFVAGTLWAVLSVRVALGLSDRR